MTPSFADGAAGGGPRSPPPAGSHPAALESAFRKLCHLSKTLDEIEAWLDARSAPGARGLSLDTLDATILRERGAGAS